MQEVVTWLPPSDSATAALVNKRFNLAVRMNVTHMDMSLITLANHCRTTASRQCPPSHTSRLLPASSEQHELQLQLSACCQQHHAMHQELLQRQQELFKHRRNLTPDEVSHSNCLGGIKHESVSSLYVSCSTTSSLPKQ